MVFFAPVVLPFYKDFQKLINATMSGFVRGKFLERNLTPLATRRKFFRRVRRQRFI